jgi:hypothetical protein
MMRVSPLLYSWSSILFFFPFIMAQTTHPNLPAAIGNLNLNVGIVIGQPIVCQHLYDARAISATLKALQKAGDGNIPKKEGQQLAGD